MRAYLSRRYRFSASHRLHNETLSEKENQETYGKCNNPHGHGHNYIVEVTAGGQIDPEIGMVCDLGQLDGVVMDRVITPFDHQNLNLDECFKELVPTTENLCIEIYHRLNQAFDAGDLGSPTLVRVRVEETNNNSFEYTGTER
jgi:6-pyruvoyltetrahydropterin/6-carboxytetrahydropterin synthase